MSEEQPQEPLEDEFLQLLKESLPTSLITNFIVIAEIAGETNLELSLSVSDGMTPWLAQGMLKTADDMIASGEYRFPTEEEFNG